MDTRIELVRDIVRSQLASVGAESIRALGEGQEHVTYEVDGRLVVRLALDENDDGCASRVAREAALLEVVGRISPIAVPQPLFVVPERCCYGYRRLDGAPLLSLAPAVRARFSESVAASLGELLAALHSTPVAAVDELAPMDLQPAGEWLRDAADLFAAVAPRVPAGEQQRIRSFLATPPPESTDQPVFSHNDLGIEHALVDPDSGRVTGVIDWSDTAICDRAYDFGLLLRDLGPTALDAALGCYGIDTDVATLTQRAWFYARCAGIEDLAYGLETGHHEYDEKPGRAAMALLARCGSKLNRVTAIEERGGGRFLGRPPGVLPVWSLIAGEFGGLGERRE